MRTKIIKYPVEKKETEGELGLQYCREKGFDDLTTIGFSGGQLDQELANIIF